MSTTRLEITSSGWDELAASLGNTSRRLTTLATNLDRLGKNSALRATQIATESANFERLAANVGKAADALVRFRRETGFRMGGGRGGGGGGRASGAGSGGSGGGSGGGSNDTVAEFTTQLYRRNQAVKDEARQMPGITRQLQMTEGQRLGGQMRRQGLLSDAFSLANARVVEQAALGRLAPPKGLRGDKSLDDLHADALAENARRDKSRMDTIHAEALKENARLTKQRSDEKKRTDVQNRTDAGIYGRKDSIIDRIAHLKVYEGAGEDDTRIKGLRHRLAQNDRQIRRYEESSDPDTFGKSPAGARRRLSDAMENLSRQQRRGSAESLGDAQDRVRQARRGYFNSLQGGDRFNFAKDSLRGMLPDLKNSFAGIFRSGGVGALGSRLSSFAGAAAEGLPLMQAVAAPFLTAGGAIGAAAAATAAALIGLNNVVMDSSRRLNDYGQMAMLTGASSAEAARLSTNLGGIGLSPDRISNITARMTESMMQNPRAQMWAVRLGVRYQPNIFGDEDSAKPMLQIMDRIADLKGSQRTQAAFAFAGGRNENYAALLEYARLTPGQRQQLKRDEGVTEISSNRVMQNIGRQGELQSSRLSQAWDRFKDVNLAIPSLLFSGAKGHLADALNWFVGGDKQKSKEEGTTDRLVNANLSLTDAVTGLKVTLTDMNRTVFGSGEFTDKALPAGFRGAHASEMMNSLSFYHGGL